MGVLFNSWINQLPALAIRYVGVKELMSHPNPAPNVLETWDELMRSREAALDELVKEYQPIPETAGPGSYPWVRQFISTAPSIARSYPGSGEYLLPVAKSFQDLARFKVLNAGPGGQWAAVVTEIELLMPVLAH
ncbi:MAG: hypothetical protein V4639_03075 [Pseudomonadota bacterium]|jgi:hypothetical protein|uniref:hypothetical protein n=2 Tax=Burkholderiales TaxID=80840 RepID=UPI0027229845|nr:hypothetical protein [Polaromonas sp.]